MFKTQVTNFLGTSIHIIDIGCNINELLHSNRELLVPSFDFCGHFPEALRFATN